MKTTVKSIAFTILSLGAFSQVSSQNTWNVGGNSFNTQNQGGSGINGNIGNYTLGPTTLDNLVLKTNDVGRVFIQSTGNVGIGTDNPLGQLQIKDLLSFNQMGTFSTISHNIEVTPAGQFNRMTTGTASAILFGNGIDFLVSSSGSAGPVTLNGKVRLNSDGKFEIGTSSMPGTLEVYGNATMESITLSTGAQPGYVLQSDGTGKGSWVNPSTFVVNDNDWLVDGNTLYPQSTTTQVGIGTTTPGALLDVAGTARIQDLQLPTGAQTGYVLQSIDASGTVVWVDASTLSTNNNGWTIAGGKMYTGTGIGSIGIGTNDPSGALQLGDEFVFQDGGSKVIGRNVKWNGTGQERLVDGVASALLFDAAGNIIFKNASNDAAGSQVEFNQAMTIKYDGKLGVGTANPQAQLHIANDEDLLVQSILTNNAGGVFGISVAGQNATISNSGTGALSILNGNTSINLDANGHVGIASNSFGNYALNVGGAVNVASLFINGQPLSSAIPSTVWNLSASGQTAELNGGKNAVVTGHLRVGDQQTPTHLYVYGQTHISGELYVCDKTYFSDKVTVSNGGNAWCDYVFEDSYPLRDLTEVESYIKANKHLPGVPSAKEIDANGIDLADMQRILMEKIEELTLYTLKQQGQIEELKKELKKK